MTDAPGRLRTVFDCNTLIQAMAFAEGPAAGCIQGVREGAVELFVSRGSLRELRRVLNYPEIRAISPQMTSKLAAAFLEWLLFRATLVRRIPHILDYPRDLGDEIYIDLAVALRG